MSHETKIICTIGPASSSLSTLHKMADAGMDVARLNFSHGTQESHAANIASIRRLNKKYGYTIKILQDLEGYRTRIGKISAPVTVTKGDVVQLSTSVDDVTGRTIPFDFTGSIDDIPVNKALYIDDGRLRFKILDRIKNGVTMKTVVGGPIHARKGINIPDLVISKKNLSAKDRNDLEFGLQQGVDIVAQSFVTTADDITLIKKYIEKKSSENCQVFAKIENRPGVANVNDIIRHCSGIMVARGDLGISIPVYKVPVAQKFMIKRGCKLKKEVIIATQMLETMTTSPYPTRAEVSDIANAIYDGADYVMLSGETAAGKYPVQAVRMMKKIVSFTESNSTIKPVL